MFSLLLQEIVLRRLWTRRLLGRSENDRRRFSSASGPDLEQSSTAPAMQPASPDCSQAIRHKCAWTPTQLRRFRKSRNRLPEKGEIGTSKAPQPDNAHYLLDTLDSCYTTIHSKPVPLWEVLSLGLSACARRWAQFRVGLVAWGMESRKESLAIKKISPRPL